MYLPTSGLCSDCLRSLRDTLCATHRLYPSRPEVNRSKDPALGGIPSEELLQAAPTDWRQPAARSSGSAFQTKCLVYKMSTMHMRWRLASSTMLHVNPKVRGQHPRLLERRAGSPPLSSRWSSTNVEITDCQLGQLITGQLGIGGGVCHHRMPPRSGRETSARIDRAPKSPYPVRGRSAGGGPSAKFGEIFATAVRVLVLSAVLRLHLALYSIPISCV